MFLPTGSIRLDFQRPRFLDRSTVEEYVTSLAACERIPPVNVYYDGETYWLADGFHRFAATARLRRKWIKAMVIRGGLLQMKARARREWQETLEETRRWVEAQGF